MAMVSPRHRGDDSSALSGKGGDVSETVNVSGSSNNLTIGSIVGGDSIAQVQANGGPGGNVSLTISPLASSGPSGASNAQSSATNTGNTGGSSSTATSNPTAQTGNSGDTGRSGDATSNISLGLQSAVISSNDESATGLGTRRRGALTSDVAAGSAIRGC